jgi:predicted MFS family arabinose efflux permease
MSYLTLLPIYADRYFAMGSTGYGLLQAAHGAGALAGTFTLATIAHRIGRPGTVLLVAGACLGFTLMLFSGSPAMWLALPMLLCVGFSNTFYLTQINTLIQQSVPDQLRGRVMSIFSLCWNLLPLGGLLAGALAAVVDARFAVLIGGAVVATSALLLLTSGRLRRVARVLP